ncbi:hypothetical protein EHP00_2497 [Ecytonucleospora hepatopenaei]|uniref:Uncharacterized protein n=1 Tax=Ecytonucleospora hepatopenaei TaxID=646526 RepID=A0A1W0E2I4_9MICR|nr:hypothetical protein EHP00_2497 [Ecytonucleospora hepatopenaei]
MIVLSNVLFYLTFVFTNNQDIVVGNISGANTKTEGGKMVGSKLIESDQDRISFNRNILENAFKRSYGTTPLSKDEKDKVKGI